MLFKSISKPFYLFSVLGGLNSVRGDCEHEELTLKTTMKQVSFEVTYFEKGAYKNQHLITVEGQSKP